MDMRLCSCFPEFSLGEKCAMYWGSDVWRAQILGAHWYNQAMTVSGPSGCRWLSEPFEGPKELWRGKCQPGNLTGATDGERDISGNCWHPGVRFMSSCYSRS